MQLSLSQQGSCPLQVFVHITIRAPEEGEAAADASVVHSTKAEEGGPGQPLAFRLGKGWRAPRSWELALVGEVLGGSATW